jgi:hypothetical protein
LHSKRVKAFKLIYLADPKRSVTTTPALGMILEDSTEVRRGSTYEQVESGKG